MAEKFSPSDAKEKIASLSNLSTSLETKKADVELLLNLCVKNVDFANLVKEKDGILTLASLFKSTSDFNLKVKITTLLVFLSLIGHDGTTTEKLMSDINVLSLVNLFFEKDFSILVQTFGGLSVLGKDSSSSKTSISFSLPAAIAFLENIAALIDSSSKLLSDSQRMEILGSFTRFTLTGVMSQAANDAAKETSNALSKNFSLAYEKFVKALEGCHTGDFSNLDLMATSVIQLVKDGKLIATPPGQLGGYLDVISQWLGGSKKFNLLYKASNDGFTATSFHTKCDNKGATVSIITSSEGFVFGGYTPLAWSSAGGSYLNDSSNQSFIFSLKNPRNEQPVKFGLRSQGNAIYCYSAYGPTFGSAHDICCANNSNSNTSSYTNITGNHGYSNTTGLDGATVFTGKSGFTAKEIEVYQIQ